MTRAISAFLLIVIGGAAAAMPSAERGEYLVQGPMGCGNCHTPFGPAGFDTTRDLGGRLVDQTQAYTVIAPNITPGSRIADWSDEDLARAIREGIRPDGSLIGPPMPFAMYRGLGDEDLASVVMYLRRMPAVAGDPGASVYNIGRPLAYGPPVQNVTAPERGATAEYGAYLAGPVSHCMECHTPMGPKGPMLHTALGAGGFEFVGPWGVSVAPNLTDGPDGLADYTDDEIKAMITRGQRPDGEAMLPPMPYGYLAKMTPEDLDAIVLYLRTLPARPSGG